MSRSEKKVLGDFAEILRERKILFYKNVVFSARAEYSYFSANFRLKIFLYYC